MLSAQANKKRKEVVLEPGDDPDRHRPNIDENPKIAQIKAKGPSGEGRRPKWRRIKPPSGEG